MSLDAALLAILACPEDKGPLYYIESEAVLYNPRLKRTYEVRDGIPVMLIEEATTLSDTEQARLSALVDEVRAPNLSVLDKTNPEPFREAVSSTTARDLTQMMVETVDSGTAAPAAIPGMKVAGKTGTAQSQADRPNYAWFVSFAPADNPQVAVAVLVEDAGVANDRRQPAGALVGGALQHRLEGRHLLLATDHGRVAAALDRDRGIADRHQAVGRNRLGLALQRQRLHRLDLDGIADQLVGQRPQQDLQGTGSLLEPGGDVDRVAGD